MMKGVDDRIEEVVFQWFCHVERMENDRFAKIFAGECAGSNSVGRPQKRWIDTVKECLRKRSFDDRQAGRILQDMSEWRGFLRWNAWDAVLGMNP